MIGSLTVNLHAICVPRRTPFSVASAAVPASNYYNYGLVTPRTLSYSAHRNNEQTIAEVSDAARSAPTGRSG